MEVYESHLGGIFFTEDLLDWEDLYCDECGDSDRHLGCADTWEEVVDLLKWPDGELMYDAWYLKDLESEFNAYSAVKNR